MLASQRTGEFGCSLMKKKDVVREVTRSAEVSLMKPYGPMSLKIDSPMQQSGLYLTYLTV